MNNLIEQIRSGAFKGDSGRVQLLRLMMSRSDWSDFVDAYLGRYESRINPWGLPGKFFIEINYITQDGPLVDAVIEFLEKEGE